MTRAFLPMFLCVVALPALADEEKKEAVPKMDLSYLEKTWGLKCKSQKIEQSEAAGFYKKLTFLLEFTKDVENVKDLQSAFEPRSAFPAFWFYLFDEENVFLAKYPLDQIEGEVSGKKGDAIRLRLIHVEKSKLEKARKIEVRPGDKPKK